MTISGGLVLVDVLRQQYRHLYNKSLPFWKDEALFEWLQTHKKLFHFEEYIGYSMAVALPGREAPTEFTFDQYYWFSFDIIPPFATDICSYFTPPIDHNSRALAIYTTPGSPTTTAVAEAPAVANEESNIMKIAATKPAKRASKSKVEHLQKRIRL